MSIPRRGDTPYRSNSETHLENATHSTNLSSEDHTALRQFLGLPNENLETHPTQSPGNKGKNTFTQDLYRDNPQTSHDREAPRVVEGLTLEERMGRAIVGRDAATEELIRTNNPALRDEAERYNNQYLQLHQQWTENTPVQQDPHPSNSANPQRFTDRTRELTNSTQDPNQQILNTFIARNSENYEPQRQNNSPRTQGGTAEFIGEDSGNEHSFD